MVLLSVLSRLAVAFGEEVLLTSSFRHSWKPCLLLTYFTSDLSPLSHQDTGSVLFLFFVVNFVIH